MKKDRRKRFRCKLCGKRVNAEYTVDWSARIITFFCPKCSGRGEFKIIKKI